MLNFLSADSKYYERKCAMCQYYHIDDIRNAYNDGFVCEIHSRKRLALDDSCPKYKKASSRTYNDVKFSYEKMINKYGSYKPHKY